MTDLFTAHRNLIECHGDLYRNLCALNGARVARDANRNDTTVAKFAFHLACVHRHLDDCDEVYESYSLAIEQTLT